MLGGLYLYSKYLFEVCNKNKMSLPFKAKMSSGQKPGKPKANAKTPSPLPSPGLAEVAPATLAYQPPQLGLQMPTLSVPPPAAPILSSRT